MAILWTQLSKAADITQGVTLSRYRLDEAEGGRVVPLIQVGNLETLEVCGVMEQESVDLLKVERYCLVEGQVLLSLRTSPFRAAVVGKATAGSLAGPNLAVLTPRARVNPYYLAGLFRTPAMVERLLTITTGSVVASLNVRQLRDFLIPLAPAEEQHLLAEALQALDTYERTSHELVRSRHQRIDAFFARRYGSPDHG